MFNVFGFYKFKKLTSLKKNKVLLQDYLIKKNIRGTIIIANEGINATISGKAIDLKSAWNLCSELFIKAILAETREFSKVEQTKKITEILYKKYLQNNNKDGIIGIYSIDNFYNNVLMEVKELLSLSNNEIDNFIEENTLKK